MTKKRILIVEDEPMTLMDEERMVRNLGYEVAGILTNIIIQSFGK